MCHFIVSFNNSVYKYNNYWMESKFSLRKADSYKAASTVQT